MKLKLFEGDYTIFNLSNEINLPICVDTSSFYYITNFENDLSLICLNKYVPKEIRKDDEWKIIKIINPKGIYFSHKLDKISIILEDAKIKSIKISTDRNSYLVINNKDIEYACKALSYNGYDII